jgi:phosphoribosyl 1,2-cyclic phosphodiesterase
MYIYVLASSSAGNCICLDDGNSSILIDAGIPYKNIVNRLNEMGGVPETIQCAFCSHEHGDHVKGVPGLLDHGVETYATEGTINGWERTLKKAGIPGNKINYNSQVILDNSNFVVTPFRTSHDTPEPCGFMIKNGDFKMGFFTDTGMLKHKQIDDLRTCDVVFCESNHDPDILRNGTYPDFLKARIASKVGHLSNQCALEIIKQFDNEVPYIIIGHLSESNNIPEKAFNLVRENIDDNVYLTVALPHKNDGSYDQIIKV